MIFKLMTTAILLLTSAPAATIREWPTPHFNAAAVCAAWPIGSFTCATPAIASLTVPDEVLTYLAPAAALDGTPWAIVAFGHQTYVGLAAAADPPPTIHTPEPGTGMLFLVLLLFGLLVFVSHRWWHERYISQLYQGTFWHDPDHPEDLVWVLEVNDGDGSWLSYGEFNSLKAAIEKHDRLQCPARIVEVLSRVLPIEVARKRSGP